MSMPMTRLAMDIKLSLFHGTSVCLLQLILPKICNILLQIIYQCVDNVMFFQTNTTCNGKKSSIKSYTATKYISFFFSKFLSIKPGVVNIIFKMQQQICYHCVGNLILYTITTTCNCEN